VAARRVYLGTILLLVVLLVSACDGLSCSPEPELIISPMASTGFVTTSMGAVDTSSLGAPVSVSTPASVTVSTTTTSTTTTSTTLDPFETYRAEMRAWKNTYAADLEAGYTVISAMRDPLSPSAEEVQAAKDLDALLTDMVAGLERVQPPPEWAFTHLEYLASLKDLAGGAHKLADAMEDEATFHIMSAITSIATAWAKGEPERTALEQTLGFSLSKAD